MLPRASRTPRASRASRPSCVACLPTTAKAATRPRQRKPSATRGVRSRATRRSSHLPPSSFIRQSCASSTADSGSCTDPLITRTDPKRPAQWLRDIARPAIPRHCARWQELEADSFRAVVDAPRADLEIVYTARCGERLPERVVYWAADGTALVEAHRLVGAERAYGAYENMGIARRTRYRGNDRLTFRIATPTPYVARAYGKRNPQQWCRHLHFVELAPGRGHSSAHTVRTKNKRHPVGSSAWHVPAANANDLYTLAVFPCTLLPAYKGRYTCRPIHVTPHASSKSTAVHVQRNTYREATRPAHGHAVGVCAIDDPKYPPLQAHDVVVDHRASEAEIVRRLHAQRRDISAHTPIVVYCANPACAAAQAVIEMLTHRGFCNVWYFKEGMGI